MIIVEKTKQIQNLKTNRQSDFSQSALVEDKLSILKKIIFEKTIGEFQSAYCFKSRR